ncbi:MAG: substrate-binding domain-containing protein [Lachnospiraceae bacterium]|nr:substrate-binding domain-containing protein [Lachnospiraceae bacterium]
MKKKIMTVVLAGVLALTTLTGCGEAKVSEEITVVSREDGSGTRGAFVELMGIEQKDESGNKVDKTSQGAEITNSTSVMLTTVAGNESAIGYVSLGSLNDDVKALSIDGVAATTDNVKNGSYGVSRPFNIVTKEGTSEVAEDFIAFILSDEGQAVVEEAGYISQGSTGAYKASGMSGKITVEGSSSVTPVMEKLKEAYLVINPDVTIEVQQSDSTTGVTSTVEGVCDIGMASRALKDSEVEQGVEARAIALDGIAVVVNKSSQVDNLTKEQVMKIYTGELTKWSEVK